MADLVVGVDVRIVSDRAKRKFAPLTPLPSVRDKWSCFYCGAGLPCLVWKTKPTKWHKAAAKEHNLVFMPTTVKELAETGWAIDHVIPKSRGGSDGQENLVHACTQCNQTKSTRTLEEFRQELSQREGRQVVFYGETL